VLPAATVASIEEQLSGACTMEIAAFDEFSKLLGDAHATREFDHVIFDTAPTGHTLRLLALPAAWSSFIETNVGGRSCLGPLSGLKAQETVYAASNAALHDAAQTTLVLVARPEPPSLTEAECTRNALSQLGIRNVRLILNGVFRVGDLNDATAVAIEARGRASLDAMPDGLRAIDRVDVPLLSFGLVGIGALRKMGTHEAGPAFVEPLATKGFRGETLNSLVEQIAKRGKGVVMTMGKGGVGKTTVAARIATQLARKGYQVTLTTTDPAAHVEQAVRERLPNLPVTRIDPALETRRYTEEVLATAGRGLDTQGRALLEEDLRSPCTEEIAVFRAFAETVAGARSSSSSSTRRPPATRCCLTPPKHTTARCFARPAAAQRPCSVFCHACVTSFSRKSCSSRSRRLHRFTKRCSSSATSRAPTSSRSPGSSTRA
jgi:arsenite/tail-anchored protein-transporting ATPase